MTSRVFALSVGLIFGFLTPQTVTAVPYFPVPSDDTNSVLRYSEIGAVVHNQSSS